MRDQDLLMPSLLATAQYVVMQLRQRDYSSNAVLRDRADQGMSYWRWLLFAAMTRVQMQEDTYLRVPHASTVHVDVKIA